MPVNLKPYRPERVDLAAARPPGSPLIPPVWAGGNGAKHRGAACHSRLFWSANRLSPEENR